MVEKQGVEANHSFITFNEVNNAWSRCAHVTLNKVVCMSIPTSTVCCTEQQGLSDGTTKPSAPTEGYYVKHQSRSQDISIENEVEVKPLEGGLET